MSKKRIWEIVEAAGPNDVFSKVFDYFILLLISLNLLAVILESVEGVRANYGVFLSRFEMFSVVVFTIEYVLRLWTCVNSLNYSKPITGRMRFAMRPLSLIDLFAILPFYLPFVGVDLRFIRILRLLRIARIAKVGRYYSSLQLIKNVFREKKEELILSGVVMVMLLISSACLMYYCENSSQPEAFPNIPATMWWSVATLTTIGYGDVCPITIMGKILASLISILGIGMFALPTGILGAGFVEEVQKRKTASSVCPHCGEKI